MRVEKHSQTKRKTSPRCGGWVLAVVWVGLVMTGCVRHKDVDTFVRTPQPLVTATEYRISPPDVVTISSRRVKEINDHREMVRTDGKVTLPLLGAYFIAGKTTEEARDDLEKLAKEFYQDADVSVRVTEYNSKKIFVWGQVGAPGPYPYDGTNTIFRTLSEAQPTHLSNKKQIEVLRPNREGKLIRRMTIDLDKMVEDGDMALNAVLEENDVIFVPANPLAAVGLTLQQLLLPIQPAASVVAGPADIAGNATGVRPYGGNHRSTTP